MIRTVLIVLVVAVIALALAIFQEWPPDDTRGWFV